LGTSWKNPDAQKKLGILRIFLFCSKISDTLWRLKKFFIYVQKFWNSEKILTFENFQAVGEYICCQIISSRL
jgi:hypothetical protein